MLDVSYAGSPLVGEHLAAGVEWSSAPAPGERYPDRVALNGTEHHLVLFGTADAAAVAHLSRRWYGLLNVVTATDYSRAPGGSESGALLVRPDGHVGFRAAPADAGGLTALDTHLDSYLRAV
jgi:6-methylpretetramide 4-monooxygenase / 4-hydroxy-6-methylpretetramide 12a-monooxygenase